MFTGFQVNKDPFNPIRDAAVKMMRQLREKSAVSMWCLKRTSDPQISTSSYAAPKYLPKSAASHLLARELSSKYELLEATPQHSDVIQGTQHCSKGLPVQSTSAPVGRFQMYMAPALPFYCCSPTNQYWAILDMTNCNDPCLQFPSYVQMSYVLAYVLVKSYK